MNLDLPPHQREELEAKVTALLLGELEPAAAEELRKLIEVDDGLRKWHEELKGTLGLVREAAVKPAEEKPLKLPQARRDELLARFKTLQLEQPKPVRISLVMVAACLCGAFILAGLLLPALSKAKVSSRRAAILSDLAMIDVAKQQWAMDKNKTLEDVPTPSDLAPYLGRAPGELPHSPDNVEFFLGKVGEPSKARIDDKDSKKFITLSDNTWAINRLAQNQPGSGGNAIDRTLSRREASSPSLLERIETSPQRPAAAPSAPPSENPAPAESSSTAVLGTGDTYKGTESRDASGQIAAANAEVNGPAPVALAPVPAPMVAPIMPPPASPAPAGPVSTEFAFQGEKPTHRFSFKRMKEAETEAKGKTSTTSAPESGPVATASPATVAAPTVIYSGERLGGSANAAAPASSVDNLGMFTLKDSPVPDAEKGFRFRSLTNAIAFGGQMTKEVNGENPGAPSLNSDGSLDWNKRAADKKDAAKEPAKQRNSKSADEPVAMLGDIPAPAPQPEFSTRDTNISTFSLNISDVSFRLAAASLDNGVMPDPSTIRSEEFINAFDYRDPEPAPGAPLAFAWERAGDPFAPGRDFLRFSVKTAAQGRDGSPLNIVLLLDKSGSMERADRVKIVHEALRVLASQLTKRDTISVIVFARTARLWVEGVPGNKAGDLAKGLDDITPEGGTNLEEAMKLAYETALRHYQHGGNNRVVLLTDGAANLGDVDPELLRKKVEAEHKQGLALDCFGIGWDGFNDPMMETLSRSGGGRYGFINTPEEAGTEFAGQLAGALRVAACDVKVQVEFNAYRVTTFRQIGYAKHQLSKEQFRDNSVQAAQIGAAESGNALYTVQVNPAGEGPVCTVRVRFRTPGTSNYQEREWVVPYTGTAVALEKAGTAMRLASVAAAFSEWLAGNSYAGEVKPDQLLAYINGIPAAYGADTRPKKLETMIRQARSINGK